MLFFSENENLQHHWTDLKQEHRRWRYHHRLLDYQSPFISFISLNTWDHRIHFIWLLDHQIMKDHEMKDNFNLKILLDHKSSDLNKTYLLSNFSTARRTNWTQTDFNPLPNGIQKLPLAVYQWPQYSLSGLQMIWIHHSQFSSVWRRFQHSDQKVVDRDRMGWTVISDQTKS